MKINIMKYVLIFICFLLSTMALSTTFTTNSLVVGNDELKVINNYFIFEKNPTNILRELSIPDELKVLKGSPEWVKLQYIRGNELSAECTYFRTENMTVLKLQKCEGKGYVKMYSLIRAHGFRVANEDLKDKEISLEITIVDHGRDRFSY